MIKEFHPDLLPKIRDLVIKANRNVLSQTLTGSWLSAFKGHGIEFSEYRMYNVGDDASMIDWKASLRARKILVKELTEEKNLKVFIFLDVSNSMLYGSDKVLKAEFAAEIVSNLAYVALKGGDAVGLAMVTDKIERFVEPNIGVRQHSIIIKNIANSENYGGDYNFKQSLNMLMGATKDRGLIIFVSDFLGMEERWQHYLKIATQRFEVLGIAIRDKRDRRLPKHAGEYVLEDPYSDEKIIIDCAQYWKPYEDHVKEEERHLTEYFRMAAGDLLVLETDEDFTKPLTKFFHKIKMKVVR